LITWKSYLIREEGVTTFDDYIASHFKRANEQEEGIIFNPWTSGPYPTWGMPALRASKAAELQGREKWRKFHLAVMKAFYTDGRDISKEHILEEIAEEQGLFMDEFVKETKNPEWERLVREETKKAQEVFGISSIPTAVVQNRFLVEGTVPVSHYKKAIAEIKKNPEFRSQNKA
jgi:predicted DsbA family dithiol-disulfide isomerase